MGSKGGTAIIFVRGWRTRWWPVGRIHWVDTSGLKFQVEEEVIGVLNVCAPNKNRARKDLWRQLQVELDQEVKWILWGGLVAGQCAT